MLFDLLARSSYAARLGAAAIAVAATSGLAGTATASTVVADWTLNAAPVAGGGYVGYYIFQTGQGYVSLDATGNFNSLYEAYRPTPTAGPQIGSAPTAVSTLFNGGGYYGNNNPLALDAAAGNNYSISLYTESTVASQNEYAFLTGGGDSSPGSLDIGMSGTSWVANYDTPSGLVSLGSTPAVINDAYHLVVNDNSGALSFLVNGVDVTPGGSVSNSGTLDFSGDYIGIQPGGLSGYNGYISDITVTTPAPEPAALGMMGAGAMGILLLRRRRA